jgi:leukotriene-A4 hydrolase
MDAFSTIPYEKGYAFVKYLQELIGVDNFWEFLRNFIKNYKFKCVDFNDVKTFYSSEVKRFFDETKANEILSSIDWETWVYSPGLPLKQPLFLEI